MLEAKVFQLHCQEGKQDEACKNALMSHRIKTCLAFVKIGLNESKALVVLLGFKSQLSAHELRSAVKLERSRKAIGLNCGLHQLYKMADDCYIETQ